MADRDSDLDLFGEPLVQPKDGRGRPEFEWTPERSNKVLLAFAAGGGQAQAAAAIGCTQKTLRKHFSRECSEQKRAAHRLDIEQLNRLQVEARKGNVTAEKALADRLEKMRLRARSDDFVSSRRAKAEKPKAKGVKQQRLEEAAEVKGRFEPRPAPRMMN